MSRQMVPWWQARESRVLEDGWKVGAKRSRSWDSYGTDNLMLIPQMSGEQLTGC